MMLDISYKTSVVISLARGDGGLDYEGFRQLAGCFIKDGDHGCIGNSGVGKEVGF